ncbi:hypothetical protein J113_07315 [Mycobacterium tuberculosis CAS/NITR204]|uniref:PPE domain-containing protein n=1 Tax=Mycobacterium tuberculosis CAS/NITR204 TaxID=1310114 RepID=R4MGD7_MYCTX|nr:hypothetical protein J113_07315 [Mycobacterium tuberculosis CAS/NITR204]
MYAGAGAGPMMAAGAAWNGLAAELGTTAASYESVITRLTTESWMGPASMAMVAAAQPYLAWLTYTAEAAAHAGSQAMASAAAYEAAYAMTVPPEVVAANRALLAALVATNVLGINTPAIMATEALYAEMWAQDALAMYGYAAASGAAGMLQPLSPPSQTTNPGGLAAQSAAVGSAAATAAVNQVSVADLISSLPNAVSGLASPVTSVLDSTGLSGIIADIDALLATPFVANIINSAVNTAAWYVNAAIPTAIFLANALNSGAPVAIAEGAIEAAEGAASAAAAGLADSVTPAGLGASLGRPPWSKPASGRSGLVYGRPRRTPRHSARRQRLDRRRRRSRPSYRDDAGNGLGRQGHRCLCRAAVRIQAHCHAQTGRRVMRTKGDISLV